MDVRESAPRMTPFSKGMAIMVVPVESSPGLRFRVSADFPSCWYDMLDAIGWLCCIVCDWKFIMMVVDGLVLYVFVKSKEGRS